MFELSNLSNILFLERVVLIEGKIEERLIFFLFEKIIKKIFGRYKCGLVKYGGFADIRKCKLVLKVMDLFCKVIVDLDYVFRYVVLYKFLNKEDFDWEVCFNKLVVMVENNKIILDENGLLINKNSLMLVVVVFVLFV